MAAALAGGVVFLAYACPLLLAAGGAILALAATVQAAGHRIAEKRHPQSEGWDSLPAKIAACMETVDRVPDDIPGRFQTLVESQERTHFHRIH